MTRHLVALTSTERDALVARAESAELAISEIASTVQQTAMADKTHCLLALSRIAAICAAVGKAVGE